MPAAASAGLTPSIGLSGSGVAPISRLRVSARRGLTRVSKKTCVTLSAPRGPDDGGQVRGARLRLGRDPHDRHLGEPVAAREVGEGGVRGDDLAARAVGEAGRELHVERVEAGDEGLRALRVGARRRPGRPARGRPRSPATCTRASVGIEPHVGIGDPADGEDAEAPARVHHHPGPPGEIGEQLLGPAVQVGAGMDEHRRAPDLAHVARRRLPVVRLDAGGHQDDHVRAVARDLAREFPQRVDGRDHQRLRGRGGGGAAGERQQRERDQ